MSTFGSPGGKQLSVKPIPPERGSFPLDHEGECKEVMIRYLSCVKMTKGNNDPECRNLAKLYLGCRMERNLMAKDEFKNLGFSDEKDELTSGRKEEKEEKGTKGELRW
ncbi:BgTH12-00126 [Blumeria graminis f. sp. triticale]|uniref:Bgt-3635 n=3 Tax=Blumeria graminis TaxID=34373 RepID=A0A381L261_BLUGR|nr:hypothetical protein BGT96224_3635 [Blumeria graminis f. sp. tritici 96224]CAD6504618.1 BgTH12-00126 [Blumeria graminis f. sp. triticale]VDB92649.1 Bgt-3635 [Blumeria graminis f. sp. tritici]